MKITNINYSQNFGLKKTNNFLNIQKQLISSADKLGRKDDAVLVADALTKLLPGDTLDFDNKHNKFILTVEKTQKRYNFGGATLNFPLEILTLLYKNLAKFENGDKSVAKPLRTTRRRTPSGGIDENK